MDFVPSSKQPPCSTFRSEMKRGWQTWSLWKLHLCYMRNSLKVVKWVMFDRQVFNRANSWARNCISDNWSYYNNPVMGAKCLADRDSDCRRLIKFNGEWIPIIHRFRVSSEDHNIDLQMSLKYSSADQKSSLRLGSPIKKSFRKGKQMLIKASSLYNSWPGLEWSKLDCSENSGFTTQVEEPVRVWIIIESRLSLGSLFQCQNFHFPAKSRPPPHLPCAS